MHPLQDELWAILTEAQRRSIPLVVLGAFAVRTYLRDPDQRYTHDVDLLAQKDAVASLREMLVSSGYQVYSSGP